MVWYPGRGWLILLYHGLEVGSEQLGVKFVDAGGKVGFAGVMAAAQDLVEFGRVAAEGRLRRGGVDDGDGYFGACWDIDGAEKRTTPFS